MYMYMKLQCMNCQSTVHVVINVHVHCQSTVYVVINVHVHVHCIYCRNSNLLQNPKSLLPSNPVSIKSNVLPPPSNKERVVLPPSNRERVVFRLPSRQGSFRQTQTLPVAQTKKTVSNLSKPSIIKESTKNLPQSSKHGLNPRPTSLRVIRKPVINKTIQLQKHRPVCKSTPINAHLSFSSMEHVSSSPLEKALKKENKGDVRPRTKRSLITIPSRNVKVTVNV